MALSHEQREREERIARIERHREAEKVRAAKVMAWRTALSEAALMVASLDNTELTHDKLAFHIRNVPLPKRWAETTPYPGAIQRESKDSSHG